MFTDSRASARSIHVCQDQCTITEHRWIILGTSDVGRLLFVAHTDRGDHLRIISARTVNPNEQG
ncbi:BrnT family toxin [Candidatus Chloroploca mongolica]|uniref:BrnT family toxin n=1 Tax=Candidatus Chloroploca mongolica TaxID=2528176 RepID=UPI001081B460